MHVILYSYKYPSVFNVYFWVFFLFYLIWYHFIDWMVEKAGGEWDIGKCYDIS